MKTKNNVQKTNLSAILAFLALALFSVTISAQEPVQHLLADNAGNYPKLGANAGKAIVASFPFYHRKIEDAALELESWMVNSKFFSNLNSELFERPLETKEWMINDAKFWGACHPEEKPLQVESWMIDSGFWRK